MKYEDLRSGHRNVFSVLDSCSVVPRLCLWPGGFGSKVVYDKVSSSQAAQRAGSRTSASYFHSLHYLVPVIVLLIVHCSLSGNYWCRGSSVFSSFVAGFCTAQLFCDSSIR